MKKFKQTIITSLLASASLLMASNASADLIIEKDQTIKPTVKVSKSKVHNIGTKTATAKFNGFGDNVSLRTALEQVVPEDWQVVQSKTSAPIDVMKPVSYSEKGEKTWDEVLPTLVDKNTTITYDWSKKSVYLANGNVKSALVTYKTGDVEKTEAKDQAPAKKVTKKVHKAKTTKAVAKKEQTAAGTWTLNPGVTLRDNLAQWATKAGYKLVWDQQAPNYMINAKATFSGEFLGEDGALSQVIHNYKDEPRSLKVSVKDGNKVIYVQPRIALNPEMVAPSLKDMRTGY